MYTWNIRNSASREGNRILSDHQRPSTFLAWLIGMLVPSSLFHAPSPILSSAETWSGKSERDGIREGDITPYLYPCMVPIKRESLTAFVSDTVAVLDEGGGASRLLSAIRFYIRVSGWWLLDGETVKRYWIHRVFHKDSMKIAQGFYYGRNIG